MAGCLPLSKAGPRPGVMGSVKVIPILIHDYSEYTQNILRHWAGDGLLPQ